MKSIKTSTTTNILSYSNWNGVGCYAMFHFVREFYPGEDFDMIWTLDEWFYG